ncbi:hypothetical protein LSAT2_012000, partial [Lamellibrachia satsuma]
MTSVNNARHFRRSSLNASKTILGHRAQQRKEWITEHSWRLVEEMSQQTSSTRLHGRIQGSDGTGVQGEYLKSETEHPARQESLHLTSWQRKHKRRQRRLTQRPSTKSPLHATCPSNRSILGLFEFVEVGGLQT